MNRTKSTRPCGFCHCVVTIRALLLIKVNLKRSAQMRSRILFISGRPADARHLSRMLNTLPLLLHHAGSLEQARAKLQEEEYDVILTEATLPDGKWLDVLHLARECPQEIEVIVTDPQADARFWAEALN